MTIFVIREHADSWHSDIRSMYGYYTDLADAETLCQRLRHASYIDKVETQNGWTKAIKDDPNWVPNNTVSEADVAEIAAPTFEQFTSPDFVPDPRTGTFPKFTTEAFEPGAAS